MKTVRSMVESSSKLGVGTAAAAAAIYAVAGGTAQAAVVHVNTPLSVGIGGLLVNWDVDGNSTTYFRLETFYSSSLSINGGGAFVNLVGSFEDGIEGFDAVASQFDVGPTLPAGHFFGQTNAIFRTMISGAGAGPDQLGWAAPTQYVGFRFTGVSGTQYGWASVTLNNPGETITVNEWAYEDTGSRIHLGEVPAPGTATLAGLALLATGGRGVRKMRAARAG